jgi:hypothetical protein
MTTTTTHTGTTGTIKYEIRLTKAQIVQRLLEEKQINAEEAVTLLMSDKEYITVPPQLPQPQQPYNPYPYIPPNGPWITYGALNTTTYKSNKNITFTN